MADWKIRRGDSEWPAESIAILQEWAKSGRLNGSDYIFNPILEKWMYAADVLELRSSLPQAPNTRDLSPSVSGGVPTSNRSGFDTRVFGVIILVIGLSLTVLGGVMFATNGRLTDQEAAALTPASTGGYWQRFEQNIFAGDAIIQENNRREVARHQATTMMLIGLPAVVIGGAIVASSKSQRSKYAGETPSAQGGSRP